MSEGRASSTKTRSRVGSSKASSVSNAAAIARAEAAKARAAFAEEEIQLKLQQASLEAERARQQASLDSQRAIEKARLEATLERLAIEKETAAAIAEAEALEDAISFDSEHSGRSSVLGPQQDPHDSLQRTSEYVQQHSKADGHPDLKPEGVHFVNKTSQPDYPDCQKASYQLPCHGQESTYRGSWTLRVDFQDVEYNNYFATYESFSVLEESQKYKLLLGTFTSGNAGDSFTIHNNSMFSTKDQDNDSSTRDCAKNNMGGWWYNSCCYANLNGLYLHGSYDGTTTNGIIWKTGKGFRYSYKLTEMKIRPNK
ncbi:uncharacterized protein [Phyllobates terribilis]|uniref:uncharacterized protein isoform X3 n=1 Tax=Phyllobates terribilis TaxID=111132 RepID=UPI003CCB6A7A